MIAEVWMFHDAFFECPSDRCFDFLNFEITQLLISSIRCSEFRFSEIIKIASGIVEVPMLWIRVVRASYSRISEVLFCELQSSEVASSVCLLHVWCRLLFCCCKLYVWVTFKECMFMLHCLITAWKLSFKKNMWVYISNLPLKTTAWNSLRDVIVIFNGLTHFFNLVEDSAFAQESAYLQ